MDEVVERRADSLEWEHKIGSPRFYGRGRHANVQSGGWILNNHQSAVCLDGLDTVGCIRSAAGQNHRDQFILEHDRSRFEQRVGGRAEKLDASAIGIQEPLFCRNREVRIRSRHIHATWRNDLVVLCGHNGHGGRPSEYLPEIVFRRVWRPVLNDDDSGREITRQRPQYRSNRFNSTG
jgi:hypothetical protein